MGEGVAVAAVPQPFPIVKIKHDALRGLLFEPWTHPTKLHHLLQHANPSLPLSPPNNLTHQLPGEYRWGRPERLFTSTMSSPASSCHLFCCVLFFFFFFFWQRKMSGENTSLNNGGRHSLKHTLHQTTTGGLCHTLPLSPHWHLQLKNTVFICVVPECNIPLQSDLAHLVFTLGTALRHNRYQIHKLPFGCKWPLLQRNTNNSIRNFLAGQKISCKNLCPENCKTENVLQGNFLQEIYV